MFDICLYRDQLMAMEGLHVCEQLSLPRKVIQYYFYGLTDIVAYGICSSDSVDYTPPTVPE